MRTIFNDRRDAGIKLARLIHGKKFLFEPGDSIVLALPRGGVVVGYEVAKFLGLPLDLILTRKIGHPQNSEFAIAAVGEHVLVRNNVINVSESYLKQKITEARREIKRRKKTYHGSKKYPALKNKKVILVDDGLATGLTVRAAIQEVKKELPKKIILAIPVAPYDMISALEPLVDYCFCYFKVRDFWSVGQYYLDFPQLDDQQVREIFSHF